MFKVVICQKTCNMEKGPKAYHVRVPFDFRPMIRLSCDIKHMPVSSKGYKYILFVTCEVSNYTIANNCSGKIHYQLQKLF